MGLTVASMGLFGIGIFYFFADIETIHAIEGFAMGASVALFSRVGGVFLQRVLMLEQIWWVK